MPPTTTSPTKMATRLTSTWISVKVRKSNPPGRRCAQGAGGSPIRSRETLPAGHGGRPAAELEVRLSSSRRSLAAEPVRRWYKPRSRRTPPHADAGSHTPGFRSGYSPAQASTQPTFAHRGGLGRRAPRPVPATAPAGSARGAPPEVPPSDRPFRLLFLQAVGGGGQAPAEAEAAPRLGRDLEHLGELARHPARACCCSGVRGIWIGPVGVSMRSPRMADGMAQCRPRSCEGCDLRASDDARSAPPPQGSPGLCHQTVTRSAPSPRKATTPAQGCPDPGARASG